MCVTRLSWVNSLGVARQLQVGPDPSGGSILSSLSPWPGAVWETWVRSLGQENPLEKGRAPHSSILAWRIPCIEEPGRLQSMGSQRVRHNGATNTFTVWLSLIVERK